MASALGAAGAGYTTAIDGKQLTFMPYTQGLMDAFESLLIDATMERAMATAEVLRRKARVIERELKGMIESYRDRNDVISDAEKAAADAKGLDMNAERLALEMEARTIVERVNEKAVAGYYHFWGECGREAVTRLHGMAWLYYLSLKEKQPQIKLDDIRRYAISGDGRNWAKFNFGVGMANGDLPKNAAWDEASGRVQKPKMEDSPKESTSEAPAEPVGPNVTA